MYPILETERIMLRPFNENDTEMVFNLVRVFDQQADKPHFAKIRTLEDAEKLNQETIKNDNEWVIIDKESSCAIGWVILIISNKKSVFLPKIFLRNEYQNKGLEREILEMVLHFAFFGVKVKMALANAKNSEKELYSLFFVYGFEIYNCVPKSKPNDSDTMVQFRISKENYTKQPHVKAGTYDYKLPWRLNSPYNTDNPIRIIDSITYIKEPTGYLCGQSVIAMLANVSVDEVIDLMQNDKGTGTQLMREALKYYGIKAKRRVNYTDGTELPECCILSLKLPGYGHWSLYHKGKYYDPEFGESNVLPKNAKLVAYMEILI